MLKERRRRNQLSSPNKQNLYAQNSTNQELLGLLEKADPTNKEDLEKISTLLDKVWRQPASDKRVIEKAQAFIRRAHQFQGRSLWEG